LEGLFSFLEKNSIYIVMIIVLIVWAGIFFFMLNLDKRIKSVEKELNGDKNEK
jgi:CcmD family protein